MVKLKTIASSLIAAVMCSSFTVTSAETVSTEDWQLVWSDEFDGDAINTEFWTHEVDCWGGGNDERQCYTALPTNAFVKDGNLHIVVRKEAVEGPALPPHMRETEEQKNAKKVQPFTSARLNTKGKAFWTYGKFEVRAKMPEGQGMWPAIWMLPEEDHYGTWAASGEIDIAEVVNLGAKCRRCEGGVRNTLLGTIHYGGEWPHNKYKGGPTEIPPSEDGFHTYTVEWKEGQIDWFLDGEHYLTLTAKDWSSRSLFGSKPKTAPFDRPFHMILNVAVGGHLPESKDEGGVSLDGFPKAMVVDYVRVYQRPDEIGFMPSAE